MRLPLIIFTVLGAGGCWGQSYPDSLQPFAQTAWTERVPGLKCDHQMTFYSDGKYLEAMICIFPDYSQGAEVNKGKYHVNGPTLTKEFSQTTCDTDQSGSVDYWLHGDTLTLYPAGAPIDFVTTAFEPGEPQDIPLGCFDINWKFTPMQLHSI